MGDPKPTRLFLMGFTDAGIPPYVLELIKEGVKDKKITITDWAMIRREPGKEAEITVDEGVDPGAGKGAATGGIAGVVLAGVLGPIGVGAIVAGAAIGAVTAKLRDAGMKDGDLQGISGLMAEGRSGLIVAVPLDDADRFAAFMAGNVEFESVIRRVQVDVVPGHSLADAIGEYQEAQAQAAATPATPG